MEASAVARQPAAVAVARHRLQSSWRVQQQQPHPAAALALALSLGLGRGLGRR
jgi:hypothetical protein